MQTVSEIMHMDAKICRFLPNHRISSPKSPFFGYKQNGAERLRWVPGPKERGCRRQDPMRLANDLEVNFWGPLCALQVIFSGLALYYEPSIRRTFFFAFLPLKMACPTCPDAAGNVRNDMQGT